MEELSACKFYIANIKLVGYGQTQSYQCVCQKCKKLFFNITTKRNLEDLFCSWCEPDESLLTEENFSDVNFVGNIIGWEIKCTAIEKKRSFYNYKKVYKRDGYQCQYCGYSMSLYNDFRALHVDHIKPWSGAGGNSLTYLVVSCAECNCHATNKWFNSFMEKKEYVNARNAEKQFQKQKKKQRH